MKYAISYNPKIKDYSKADEIVIAYQEHIVDIVNKYITPEQKVIINITGCGEDALEDLLTIKENYKNILIQFSINDSEEWIQHAVNAGIPFMFSNFARTRTEVSCMCKAGSVEIYIVESLGFSITDLQYYREKYNIKFRMFPDVAQYPKGMGKYIPALLKFFIRPEDVELYEGYIDTLEIFRSDDRVLTVLDIYKQRQWLGNINQLIVDFKEDIENTTIAPHFGRMRLNCNKMCLEGKCHICEEIGILAGGFKQADLEIVKKRHKPIEDLTKEEKENILNSIKKEEKE